MKRFLLISILLSLSVSCMYGVEEKSLKAHRFELGPDTILILNIDPLWQTDLVYKERVATELSIKQKDNPNEKCRIYVIPQRSTPNPGSLIPMLRENGKDLLKKSMEAEFSFIPLADQQGYYYILTDKAPKSGEPPILCRGGLVTARHIVLFTILFERKESPFFKEMIRAMSSTRISYPQN